jgi:hypothetical protein
MKIFSLKMNRKHLINAIDEIGREKFFLTETRFAQKNRVVVRAREMADAR